MSPVTHRRSSLALAAGAFALALSALGPGCRKASPEAQPPRSVAQASPGPVVPPPPTSLGSATPNTGGKAPAAAPLTGPLHRPLPPGGTRPAGFRRYDEPKEALEFYARKRAPVGQGAIPSDRYRAARQRIAGMPVYSTRTGAVGAPRSSRGTEVSAASGGPDIGTWTPLGPGNIGGRTRAIVIDPSTPATMYAGAVAGGVWKTTNSGASWSPTDDAMANLAVSTLAMDPNASLTLLAGTGEGFFNSDAVRGAGIFKTVNGGVSWTQVASPGTGLDKTCEFHYINKIVYSRQQANTAYAAVGYSESCDGSNTGGIYRTTNGGTTWTRIRATTVNGGCLDVAVRNAPNDPLFASCGTFAQAEIYRNNSALTTPTSFTNIASTVSPGLNVYMGRTSFAIAPSNPNTLYIVSADNYYDDFLALWQSTDGGFTWSERSSYLDASPTRRLFTNLPYADCFSPSGTYNQGWYDNVMAVDPSDENVVWVGGIDLFRSDNGGASFGLASFWYGSGSSYAHADQHALVFGPTGALFVGNDGGLFRASNPNAALATDTCDTGSSSVTFTSLDNGYAVTQFYYGAVLPNDTEYFGGAQDNGTLRGATAGSNWSEMLGGDGGAVAVNPLDTQILYGEFTYCSIQKSTNGGASFDNASAGISDSGCEFIAPFVIDPSASTDAAAADRLWTGGDYLWRTTNAAASWVKASAKLASSTTAIAIAPSNPNFALAGTQNGVIYRSSTALSDSSTTTWGSKAPRTGYVSSVAFDPRDANVAYATYSTFGGTHVWKSTDAGAHWVGLDGSGTTLPDLPVHSIVVDPTTGSRLYLGTDLGVFVSIDGGANWNAENSGFGNVVTEHLVANGANLYAFTHGRGVWRVPLTNTTQTALIELVAPSSSVTEGDPPTNVTQSVQVRIRTSDNAALAAPASVQWATADGTAKAGSDYVATSGTLTFPAGSTHDGDIKTIDITIVSDLIGEPTQAFTLELSSPTGAILARRVHTVSIYDTLTDPPGISINDISVTEGNTGTTNATFTLALSGPAKAGTTVTYQTADGTAHAGVDYNAVGPVVLAIPTGASSKTLSIQVRNNTVAEPSRAFFVNLIAASKATIDDGQGQATIVDNDFSGTIAFSAAAYAVSESAGKATILLRRTGGVASGVTVQVEAQAGTATGGGVDFTAPATPVTFAAGATTASFTVPITADTIDEPAETVLLRLFGPTGLGAALGAPQTAILTINDDDVGGVIKLGAATYAVTEGGGVDIKVARSGGAAIGVTVGYTLAGSATGADYSITPASPLTFAAGEMVKVIHVDAVADGSPEGNETVALTLNPPTGGATLGSPSSTVLTIADLEPTFAFTVSSITVAETAKTVVATVRRTGPLTAPATVQFTTANGTATGGINPGDDFLPISGTLTFPAKAATRNITVTLRPDSDFEPSDSFSIALSSPSAGTLVAPSSLTVNIPNDDFGGTFFFAAPTYTVLESKPSLMLTIRRTGGLANADVSYQTADGTATSGSDYTGVPGPTPLHFAAGKTSATILIPILQDTIGEGNETFTVSLSSPTAGGSVGTPSTTVVTIQDDDRLVAFGAAAYSAKEPLAGTVNLVIPVKRTGPAGAFSVAYAVTGGTATLSSDFTLSPASPLTFLATDTVKNLTFTTTADLPTPLYEGTETAILTLSSPTNNTGLGAVPATTVSITDQQPVISLGAAAYTVTEPASTTPIQAVIAVRRMGNLQSGSDVSYTITPGTATAGVDYDPAGATPPASVHFAAGQSTAQIKVPILPDTDDEPAETFTVALTAPIAAHLGTLTTATVTVNDNDVAGKIQIVGTQYAVLESAGAAVIQLTRTGGTAGNASVVCRTANGTATAGSDYTATTQTVIFGPRQTSATCTIPITDDATPGEGAETVLVSIDTPSFGVILGTQSTATLYIVDND